MIRVSLFGAPVSLPSWLTPTVGWVPERMIWGTSKLPEDDDEPGRPRPWDERREQWDDARSTSRMLESRIYPVAYLEPILAIDDESRLFVHSDDPPWAADLARRVLAESMLALKRTMPKQIMGLNFHHADPARLKQIAWIYQLCDLIGAMIFPRAFEEPSRYWARLFAGLTNTRDIVHDRLALVVGWESRITGTKDFVPLAPEHLAAAVEAAEDFGCDVTIAMTVAKARYKANPAGMQERVTRFVEDTLRPAMVQGEVIQ